MAEFIAQHTVASGDTLSALALKYYGSADEDKWRLIYTANQEVIGPNPGILHIGTVLNIPALAAAGREGPMPKSTHQAE